MEPVIARLPDEMFADLRELAARRDRVLATEVRRAIRLYLAVELQREKDAKEASAAQSA